MAAILKLKFDITSQLCRKCTRLDEIWQACAQSYRKTANIIVKNLAVYNTF